MSTPPLPHRIDPAPNSRTSRKRPAWRQRLVQAERGFVGGIRTDSEFFVYFFGASFIIVAGLIFGLDWTKWIAVIFSLTLILSAELFHHALKTLVETLPQHPQSPRIIGLGTAAVMVVVGSMAVIGIIFGQRLTHLFAL